MRRRSSKEKVTGDAGVMPLLKLLGGMVLRVGMVCVLRQYILSVSNAKRFAPLAFGAVFCAVAQAIISRVGTNVAAKDVQQSQAGDIAQCSKV